MGSRWTADHDRSLCSVNSEVVGVTVDFLHHGMRANQFSIDSLLRLSGFAGILFSSWMIAYEYDINLSVYSSQIGAALAYAGLACFRRNPAFFSTVVASALGGGVFLVVMQSGYSVAWDMTVWLEFADQLPNFTVYFFLFWFFVGAFSGAVFGTIARLVLFKMHSREKGSRADLAE